jgi:hypothetical protein
MNAFRWGVLVVALSAVLFLAIAPAQGQAQGPGDAPVKKAEFEARMAKIEKMILALQKIGAPAADAPAANHATAPTEPTRADPPPAGSVTQEEFNALKKDVEAVKDTVNWDSKVLHTQVGQKLADGRGAPKIWGNMASPEFREELQKAVNASMNTMGTLHVVSYMSTPYWLRVNGQPYLIPAGSERKIAVPTGTVTTELVGYEAPKHLSITPPTYWQDLILAPQEPRYMSVRMGADNWEAAAPSPAPVPPAPAAAANVTGLVAARQPCDCR